MRRLPRILLNAATVASLALFAATVALWVRDGSKERDLYSGGEWGGWEYVVSRNGGKLMLTGERWSKLPPDQHRLARLRAAIHKRLPGLSIDFEDVGQSWTTEQGVRHERFRKTADVRVAWWLLALVWSALPAWRMLPGRCRHADTTLCPSCG